MSKTQQLIKCFYHMRMLSAFRIQPMGKAISYLFFLSLVVLIPVLISSIFTYLISNKQSTIVDGVSSGVFLVIFLPFIYFIIALILFIYVSLLASMALGYARIRTIKADYKQLWNISAFSITAPTLVLVLVESFFFSGSWLFYLYIFSSFVYLGLPLKYLPKKK